MENCFACLLACVYNLCTCTLLCTNACDYARAQVAKAAKEGGCKYCHIVTSNGADPDSVSHAPTEVIKKMCVCELLPLHGA